MKTIFARLKKLLAWVTPQAEQTASYGTPGQGHSFWLSVASSISLFLLWWLLTVPLFNVETDEGIWEQQAIVQPLFLPGPKVVVERFFKLFSEEFNGANLHEHIGWSIFRVFFAFSIAIITAVPIGLLMGLSATFKGIFDPPIEFYRPIPPLAYLPLMIIWFGIGELAKILLIFLAIFSAIVLNTRAGVRSTGIEQIHAAYSMGASKFQIITQVIFKAAMPEILTGLRIGIGFGWTTLVAAELVAAQAGIGAMIKGASDFLVTDVVIVGIIIIGLIAYLFDLLMRYLERIIVPWKGKMT